MLEFKKISFGDAETLYRFYDSCPYESCEYSAGIKLFWNEYYPYEYAVSKDGALIVKYPDGDDTVFEMPVLPKYEDLTKLSNGAEPGQIETLDIGENDITALNKALDEIDDYCKVNEIIPVFSDIPKALLNAFTDRYNYLKIENYRAACDYIYSVENLKNFKGRHYAGQRNHINKFKSLYPDWSFRKLNPGEDLSAFWDEYYALANKTSDSALQEKNVAISMVRDFDKCPGLVAGAIEVEGKIAALSVGEISGDTIIIHIEKALTSYEGIYPMIVSEFLKAFAGSEILWVNREEDDSDRGLRTSKLQYRPDRLLNKYVVLPHSELLYVQEIPALTSERLTLDAINEDDAAAYQKLCLDYERNKYWGYDFREDLEADFRAAIEARLEDSASDCDMRKIYDAVLPNDYFYQIAKSDFERRMCINFAIRLEGKFIGEVVIYQADLKGSAEIGCRILPEYAGRGFGREAFAAAADWAIYGAGFRHLTAKCFKENLPSFKMLSSCMKKSGEDRIYFYFTKTV